MTKAAENPGGGGGIGAGIGMGMGMAMAERMARRGPWGDGARPPRRRRRRRRAEQRWHVAEDGKATGPFSRDELGRMAAEGSSTPRQLALDAGRAGLAARPRGGELADLFSAPPPPPPPAERDGARPGRRRGARRSSTASPARPAAPDLRFAPGSTRLKCAHCGHEEPIPRAPRADPRARPARGRARRRCRPRRCEEIRVAQCPSCGAQIEFDADLHAKECPFCASPIVTDTGVQRQIKPQAQLPFLLERGRRRGRR